MKPRFLAHAIALGALLLIAATARAGDETCYPIEVDWYSPTGIAGCTLDGPTDGIASVYGGGVAAANWCTYPWDDCGYVRVQSHQTGLTITVLVAMYGDLYTNTPDERLVDLTYDQVRALGLLPEAGLFRVTVTPIREAVGAPRLPDTAYNGITEDESVDAIESQSPGRRTHPTFGRGIALLEDESR